MKVKIEGRLAEFAIQHPALGATVLVVGFMVGVAACVWAYSLLEVLGFWGPPAGGAVLFLGTIWWAIFRAARERRAQFLEQKKVRAESESP